MSIAERGSDEAFSVAPSGTAAFRPDPLRRYRQVHVPALPRTSLAVARVLLDVVLGLALLLAGGIVSSSLDALVTAVALGAASLLLGRHRSASLEVRSKLLDHVPHAAQVGGIATVLIGIGAGLDGGGALALTWALTAGGCTLSHTLGSVVDRRLVTAERVLLVGPDERCDAFARSLAAEGVGSLEVVATVPSDRLGPSRLGRQPIEALIARHDVSRVIILCGDNPSGAAQAARRARNAGVRVSLAPESMESIGAPEHVEHVGRLVLLSVAPGGTTPALHGKRALDVAGAIAAVVAFAPVMAAIAVAIKLTSRGPVLFWQDRVGLNGQRFRIAKFRSMVVDAEARKAELRGQNEAGGGLFKMARDPRVTPVGRLIRKTSLDELPQLINVLRGEMSLVGPRPLVLDEDVLVGGWHRDRLQLKPGMTGRWQVMGSARIPMHEMVALDQQYVASWSLWMDLKILLRTAVFVVRRQGL